VPELPLKSWVMVFVASHFLQIQKELRDIIALLESCNKNSTSCCSISYHQILKHLCSSGSRKFWSHFDGPSYSNQSYWTILQQLYISKEVVKLLLLKQYNTSLTRTQYSIKPLARGITVLGAVHKSKHTLCWITGEAWFNCSWCCIDINRWWWGPISGKITTSVSHHE
jgi:hypothetical protein